MTDFSDKTKESFFEFEGYVYKVTENPGRRPAAVMYDFSGKSHYADANYITLNGNPISEKEFKDFLNTK